MNFDESKYVAYRFKTHPEISLCAGCGKTMKLETKQLCEACVDWLSGQRGRSRSNYGNTKVGEQNERN